MKITCWMCWKPTRLSVDGLVDPPPDAVGEDVEAVAAGELGNEDDPPLEQEVMNARQMIVAEGRLRGRTAEERITQVPGNDGGPGLGCTRRIRGGSGCWWKSNSLRRSPRIFTFSRTVGRASGRPSVLGFRA